MDMIFVHVFKAKSPPYSIIGKNSLKDIVELDQNTEVLRGIQEVQANSVEEGGLADTK